MPGFFDPFTRPANTTPTATVTRVPAGQPYALAALTQETERVAAAANGTRNHTLNAAAFNLAQLVAVGALNEDDVRDQLTAAGNTCGLDTTEIAATINSGIRAGQLHPRTIPEPAPRQHLEATVLGEPIAEIANIHSVDIADKVRERLPILDWHDVWNHIDEEDWIVEPLLPARRLVALYSAPKVGKSLLMLELAVAISRGTPVLGTKIDRPRRVLYVDFENDPYADIRERLQAMHVTPEQLDNLCYLSFPTIGHLDGEAGSLELLAAAEVYNCEVVVIDTVSRSVGGDENENDTWLNFYRHTGMKLKKAQKALIRLDHTGKDESKGQRGGSAKVGDVDAVWKMTRVTDTTFRLDCEAHRMPIAEKTLVLHRETNPLHHKVEALGAYGAYRAREDEWEKALTEAGAGPEVSVRTAQEILRAASLGGRQSAIRDWLGRRRGMTLMGVSEDPDTADKIQGLDTSPDRFGHGVTS